MDAKLDLLVRRVERLERSNRALKAWAGGAAALAAVLALGSAMTVCKTVWAERFIVKDARGNERAVITAYETGGPPQLVLKDEKGRSALTIGVDEQGVAYAEVPGPDGLVRSPFAAPAQERARPTRPPGAGEGATVGMATR